MVKPANEQAKYRYFTLKNGMEILIIQNNDKVSGARISNKINELFQEWILVATTNLSTNTKELLTYWSTYCTTETLKTKINYRISLVNTTVRATQLPTTWKPSTTSQSKSTSRRHWNCGLWVSTGPPFRPRTSNEK